MAVRALVSMLLKCTIETGAGGPVDLPGSGNTVVDGMNAQEEPVSTERTERENANSANAFVPMLDVSGFPFPPPTTGTRNVNIEV